MSRARELAMHNANIIALLPEADENSAGAAGDQEDRRRCGGKAMSEPMRFWLYFLLVGIAAFVGAWLARTNP